MRKKKRKYIRTATWYATHGGGKFKEGDILKLDTSNGIKEFRVKRLCPSDKYNFPIYTIAEVGNEVNCGDWAEANLSRAVEKAKRKPDNSGELLGRIADYEQRICNLRMGLAEWNQAFPNLTAQQAKAKMDQLQNDRNGMMGASNTCIAEANKLRQVNAKLVEVINLLTR